MDFAGYVFGSWGATAVVLAAYSFWVLRRGRKLSGQVPEERRRWSDSP